MHNIKSPVLLALMERVREPWAGTASELLAVLDPAGEHPEWSPLGVGRALAAGGGRRVLGHIGWSITWQRDRSISQAHSTVFFIVPPDTVSNACSS